MASGKGGKPSAGMEATAEVLRAAPAAAASPVALHVAIVAIQEPGRLSEAELGLPKIPCVVAASSEPRASTFQCALVLDTAVKGCPSMFQSPAGAWP